MSTSLAEQLRRLAVPQTSLLYDSKKRPSILFDPKEAAAKDRTTIFEIGYKGLMELAELNPIFLQFEQTLFDRSSLTLERSVESKEVNKQLNKTIKRFFFHLSPYFMLKPAHMCLEWLIRRYHIEQFNKTDILQLIFPYHETKMFVKCLQLLELKDTNDGWSWLQPIQQPGVSLSKSAVLNRAATDPAFLKFICNVTLSAVNELDTKAHTLQAQFAFYCTSVIGALEYAHQVEEWHISAILLPMLKGLTSKVIDFCAAAYMIAAQLVAKVQLNAKLLEQIVIKASQVEHTKLQRGALSLLLLIFQNQSANIKTLPKESLAKLIKQDWLPLSIDTLAKQGAIVSSLCEPLFSGCLQVVQAKETNWQRYKDFLENFLMIVNLQGNEANNLIRAVLDNYCVKTPVSLPDDSVIELDSDDDEVMLDGDVQGWYSGILQQLERQYPAEFDFVLKETMKSQGNVSESRRLALKTALSFRLKSLYSKDDVSVYENLYHYNPHHRTEAVKFLVKNFEQLHMSNRDSVLKESLLDRLDDTDPKVLIEVLKLPTVTLLETLGMEMTVTKLIGIIRRRRPKKDKWAKVVSEVLEHLLKESVAGRDNLHRVILAVVPLLFPATEQDVLNAKMILSSELMKSIPFFGILSTKTEKSTDPAQFSSIVEEHLSSTAEVLNIEDLLKAFTDTRDSLGFLLLIGPSYKPNTNESTGLETVDRLLEICQKNKFVIKLKKMKMYQKLPPGTVPLPLVLSRLQVIAERSGYLNSGTLDSAAKCAFVKIFEYLLTKSFVSKPESGKSQFTETLRYILCKAFPTTDGKLDFLATYFIQSSSNDDELEIQIRAIRLFDIAVASSKPDSHLSKECFVKVLAALCSKTDIIRECAITALKSLHASKLLDTKLNTLAKSLCARNDEILMDHEQLPLILFTVIMESRSGKVGNVLYDLIEIVTSERTTDVLKAETLNMLKHINSASIFRKLLVTGMKTLEYTERLGEKILALDRSRSTILYHITNKIDLATIKVFNEDLDAWQFVKRLLRCQHVRSTSGNKPSSIASTLLTNWDETLFQKLTEKLKVEFTEEVITALTVTDDPNLISVGKKLMKRLTLDAKHVEAMLHKMKLAYRTTSANIPPEGKYLAVNPEIFSNVAWKKGVTVLEILQNKNTLENIIMLVVPLVDILKECLTYEEQSNFEYSKQLVLSALLQCSQSLAEDRRLLNNLPENAFRIDLIVQCIRSTPNPQTHHHALLLLSQCAHLFPEPVLHHIMNIFTFMGSAVVRHDDAFSFQIIVKIIESIIPTLINFESEDGQSNRVVPILRIFSDIVLDVPEHRRLPLYTKLIRTLGATNYLWMFLCVLLESHVTHDNDKLVLHHYHFSKNPDEIPKRVEFALQLMSDFDVKTALETCIALFQFLSSLLAEKERIKKSTSARDNEVVIFDVDANNSKQLRHFKYVLVQVVSKFTSSAEFLNRVAAMTEDETKVMKPFYQDFLIKILCYVPQVSEATEQSAGTSKQQYWKIMLHYCYDVLENATCLLSPDMLLMVVHGLMQHKLLSVRRKVIDILILKLQSETSYFANCNEVYLLDLLDDLSGYLDKIIDKTITVNNDMLCIQQSALIALELFSRFLAVRHLDTFKEVLAKLTRILKKHVSVPRIIVAAVILAITEITANLKAQAISQLSKFMPFIVEVLQAQADQLKSQAPDSVCIAIITGVRKLFETLPLFLGPYMVELLCSAFGICVQLEKHENEQRKNEIVKKLGVIWSRIAATIPLRVIMPVADKTYKKLTEDGQYGAIKYLMTLLNECLAKASSEDIHSLLGDIHEFYLNILDFRLANKNNVNAGKLRQIEESILESFVSLVLKLSESSFRPLYHKLYDWALRGNEEKDRVITYFLLSAKIADALKSLFVLFASDIVQDCGDLLDKCNLSKAGDDPYLPDSDNIGVLIENILKTLHKIFIHDSKCFVNEHRFDILMQPIVDQLQNRLVLENESLSDLLKSCISEFAHVIQSDMLWKRLNYQILMKTRNNNPEIRIAALNCCVEIARKLGEQFIPLLPETVPFMAELLEDEVERVEKACRRGVQELEKSLGISIQEYF